MGSALEGCMSGVKGRGHPGRVHRISGWDREDVHGCGMS